jgi:hypothetical protein
MTALSGGGAVVTEQEYLNHGNQMNAWVLLPVVWLLLMVSTMQHWQLATLAAGHYCSNARPGLFRLGWCCCVGVWLCACMQKCGRPA